MKTLVLSLSLLLSSSLANATVWVWDCHSFGTGGQKTVTVEKMTLVVHDTWDKITVYFPGFQVGSTAASAVASVEDASVGFKGPTVFSRPTTTKTYAKYDSRFDGGYYYSIDSHPWSVFKGAAAQMNDVLGAHASNQLLTDMTNGGLLELMVTNSDRDYWAPAYQCTPRQ